MAKRPFEYVPEGFLAGPNALKRQRRETDNFRFTPGKNVRNPYDQDSFGPSEGLITMYMSVTNIVGDGYNRDTELVDNAKKYEYTFVKRADVKHIKDVLRISNNPFIDPIDTTLYQCYDPVALNLFLSAWQKFEAQRGNTNITASDILEQWMPMGVIFNEQKSDMGAYNFVDSSIYPKGRHSSPLEPVKIVTQVKHGTVHVKNYWGKVSGGMPLYFVITKVRAPKKYVIGRNGYSSPHSFLITSDDNLNINRNQTRKPIPYAPGSETIVGGASYDQIPPDHNVFHDGEENLKQNYIWQILPYVPEKQKGSDTDFRKFTPDRSDFFTTWYDGNQQKTCRNIFIKVGIAKFNSVVRHEKTFSAMTMATDRSSVNMNGELLEMLVTNPVIYEC